MLSLLSSATTRLLAILLERFTTQPAWISNWIAKVDAIKAGDHRYDHHGAVIDGLRKAIAPDLFRIERVASPAFEAPQPRGVTWWPRPRRRRGRDAGHVAD